MITIAMVRKAPLDDYLVETLLPDLIGHDRSPSAFLVYLKLWHMAGGPGARLQTSLPRLRWKRACRNPRSRQRCAICAGAAISPAGAASPTAVPIHTVNAPWRGR